MSLESEMLLDAKLIMRDGLVRSRPGTNVDPRGYVGDWRSNLIAGISPDLIEVDFRQGQGSELDSKFLATHSSAALVVNVFGPFRDGRDAFAMPGLGNLTLRQFEKTFPTGVPKGIPPHLDAEASGPEGIVAIESKCLEYFAPKAAKFAPAYQLLSECQKTPWFAEMERLRDSPTHYRHLDAAQLIKHAFGLIHSAPSGAALLYLFWEPKDAMSHRLFAEHRREIAEFAGRVAGGGPSFKAMSYPELWADWARSDTPKLRDHAEHLFARYGGSLGPTKAIAGSTAARATPACSTTMISADAPQSKTVGGRYRNAGTRPAVRARLAQAGHAKDISGYRPDASSSHYGTVSSPIIEGTLNTSSGRLVRFARSGLAGLEFPIFGSERASRLRGS